MRNPYAILILLPPDKPKLIRRADEWRMWAVFRASGCARSLSGSSVWKRKRRRSRTISEVYSEAKGTGFDIKVLRQIVRLRKMDAGDRNEMEEVLDVYKRALGM